MSWESVRGASVVYMAFVGVVFNTPLVDVDLGGLLPWINTVHRLVVPLAVVIDWLVFPPRGRVSLPTAFLWVTVPIVYTVYSVTRGAIVDFYCYPFFDPAAVGGYGGVAIYSAALLVTFVALLVRAVGHVFVEGAR